MSKKTIISDFCALKGKVTFSEMNADEKTSAQVIQSAETQKPADTDKCLKVGQSKEDLHIEAIPGGLRVPQGQQLQFQIDTFRRIIRENINRKGMKITFIHGIGDGILKAAIRKELDEVLALRCSYSVGDPAVTVVTIK